MQTRSFDLSDRPGWEAAVKSCGGNGLHMPEVYLSDHDPASLLLLVVEDAGAVAGCALAIHRPAGALDRLRRRQAVFLMPTAPAVADPAHARPVRDALLAHARGLGAKQVAVQPGYGTWMTGDEDLARFRTGSITEFVIDLGPGYDAVLAGMHKIHRKNIRRAQRAELEIVEDSSLDGLLALRTMQLASSERAGEKTEGFAVRDETYFRDIQKHVYGPGLGTLLFTYLGGEPVAALAWLHAADRVLTVRSGSLPVGYESRAMYLLHDELIRRAIDASAVELNIGGVPTEASERGHAQAGLYEFKKGFGGTPMERHGLEIPLAEVERS